MFRHYEKTFHLENVAKRSLTKDEVAQLFNGEVIIEEKMDGANTGIIRHKKGFHLQKRGSLVGQSEHAQFGRFHNWASYQNYEKLMKLPVGVTVYGEWLYAVHSVFYDKLPDYFLVFDVWQNEKYLPYDERIKFCEEYGFHSVPLIARGHFTKETAEKLMPNESRYGSFAEGMVIKRYTKKTYHRGKMVKEEFRKILEESDHWIHGPLKENIVVSTQ